VLEGAEAARVLENPSNPDSNRAYDNYEAIISEPGPDANPRTSGTRAGRG